MQGVFQNGLSDDIWDELVVRDDAQCLDELVNLAIHLYNQIREGDGWKTTFNTHLGHFEYLVIPLGLTNAPSVFQALVHDILRDLLDRFGLFILMIFYFFSQNLEEQVGHVHLVLQRLLVFKV